LNFTDRMKI